MGQTNGLHPGIQLSETETNQDLRRAYQDITNLSITLQNFGPATIRWVLQMMHSILKSHTFPKLWGKSKMITILKTGKDSALPKSYRPISLLSHTYKLFERVILNRLKEEMIIDQQAEFRPERSTTGQLLKLTQVIEDGFE